MCFVEILQDINTDEYEDLWGQKPAFDSVIGKATM